MRELGALSSDAERAAAVRRLADAYGEGRLTLDELTRRNELALGARTRGDIARTLDQLPGPRAAGPPRRRTHWGTRPEVVPSGSCGS